MYTPQPDPPPVSVRRAIALAFDLALRRDPIQSLVVPLLLRAPWILTLGLISPGEESDSTGRLLLLGSVALLGDYLALMITSAMLRFRALSVYDAPPDARPDPALECYARGLVRVPWLIVTEFVRYAAALFGLFFLIVPGVVLGFRLAFAAEAVTLHEPHLSAAFERSYRLSVKRFERWLELSVASVLPVIAVWFVIAGRSLLGSEPVPRSWFTAAWLLFAAWTPIVLYAWTFFYLRLVQLESPGIEVGPAYAGYAAPSVAAPAILAGAQADEHEVGERGSAEAEPPDSGAAVRVSAIPEAISTPPGSPGLVDKAQEETVETRPA